ncbi:hypothetical protein C8R46DRAFT_1352052 [Mycena filopes]|nr:hypothetical protein C8R46DRAFT_1352052 [Mycena filopes]
MTLVLWSPASPDDTLLKLELYADDDGRHRVALGRHAREELVLGRPVGTTNWSDVQVVYRAIQITLRGVPYNRGRRHFYAPDHQNFVEELGGVLTTERASIAYPELPTIVSSEFARALDRERTLPFVAVDPAKATPNWTPIIPGQFAAFSGPAGVGRSKALRGRHQSTEMPARFAEAVRPSKSKYDPHRELRYIFASDAPQRELKLGFLAVDEDAILQHVHPAKRMGCAVAQVAGTLEWGFVALSDIVPVEEVELFAGEL